MKPEDTTKITSTKGIIECDRNIKLIEIRDSKEFNFEINDEFTISLWLKFYDKQNCSVLSKMNDDGSDFFKGWDIRLQVKEGKQVIIFHLNHKYPSDSLIHKTHEIENIGDYKWHHLAIIYNGNAKDKSIQILIDGKVEETHTVRSTLMGNVSNNLPIVIGSRTNDSNYFTGKIFDVTIIKKQTSIEEIRNIINNTEFKKEKTEETEKNKQKDAMVIIRNVSRDFKIFHEDNSDIFNKMKSIVGRKTKYEKLHVLDKISFELKKGEILGILGRNGSGKTTLLKIIGKIMSPTTGEIKINGTISSFLSLGSGFYQELTAKQNIVLYGTILGEDKKEMVKKIPEVIKFAELEEFADIKIKDFSTGMMMRLAISTALCVNPDILLIDEVLSVGDYSFQKKSYEAFHKLKNAGKSIIFVSHNFRQLEQFCDRLILLEDGKIIQVGKPEEIIQSYIKMMDK